MMKRLLFRWQAASKRTVISLALGIALIWLLGPMIAIAGMSPLASLYSRVLCSVIFLLGFELYLNSQQSAEPSFQRSQDNSEEGVMRQAFAGAVAFLHKTTLKTQQGKSSLFELPWHLMIGAPGSGKSTLVARADLKFVLSKKSARDGMHKSVSNTRFCDWWVTREAVILDTSGHFFLPDKAHQQYGNLWYRFLHLVKQARPRDNIQSVIVALNALDLLRADSQHLHTQQQALCQRIHDIQQYLGADVPMHIVITQTDHIAGFKEFFADQNEQDRGQVWGVQLTGDAFTPEQPLQERFFSAYATLLDQLNTRVIWRLHQSHQDNKNALIKDFPLQMDRLQPVLSEYLKAISGGVDAQFESSNQLNLQGIYFTSAEQGTRSVNPLLAPLRKALNFPLVVKAKRAPVTQKNYFAHAMFKHLIFSPNSEEKTIQTRTWVRNASIAILAAAVLSATLFFARSFKQQNIMLNHVQQALITYQSLVKTSDQFELHKTVAALDSLAKAQWLLQQKSKQSGLLVSAKSASQGQMAQRVTQAYQTALNKLLLTPLQYALSDDLQTELHRPKHTHRDYVPLYQRLNLMLMLTKRTTLDMKALTPWLEQQLKSSAVWTDADKKHLAAYLQRAIKQSTSGAIAQNDALNLSLVQARAALQALNPVARAYVMLQAHAPLHAPEITLFSDATQSARALFNEKVKAIPFFYTTKGFETIVAPFLQQAIDDTVHGNAVLGRLNTGPVAVNAQQLSHRLMQTYTAEYAYYWQALLQGLTLKPVTTLSGAQKVLLALNADDEGDALLSRMQLATQVMLPALPSTADTQPWVLRIQNSIRQKLAPLTKVGQAPLTATFRQSLQDLLQVVDAIQSAKDPKQQAFEVVRDKLLQSGDDGVNGHNLGHGSGSLTGRDNLFVRLTQLQPQLPAPMRQWAKTLQHDIWQQLLKGTRTAMLDAWKTQVWPAYQKINAHYPLLESSRHDISLKEFGAFFGPDGVFTQFGLHYVLPFVDTLNNEWHWKKLAGTDLKLDESVLSKIKQGMKIQKMFFQNKSPNVNLQFSLVAHALSPEVVQFNLNLDGQHLQYPAGSASNNHLSWPGAVHRNHFVKLYFKRNNGRTRRNIFRGPWALFRLLDTALVEKTNDPKLFNVTLNLKGSAIKYKLISPQLLNPFNRELLTQFELPEKFGR